MQVPSLQILRTIARTTATISLKDAIYCANVGLVMLLLLEQTVDDDDFVFACTHGHTKIVRLLLELERGVDPAAIHNLALCNASFNGHAVIVRLLLDLPSERGVNPAARDNTAVHLAVAIERGHTEIVYLLDARGQQN